MYIKQILIENFRTFDQMPEIVTFIHPEQNYKSLGLPKPKIRNANLLLGDNGSGKTTLLQAIALAALGPAVGRSGIYPYRLVRIKPDSKKNMHAEPAKIEAEFIAHEQDKCPVGILESKVEVTRQGDLEILEWRHHQEKKWHPVFSDRSDAMFVVGYGSNRRIEKSASFKRDSRSSERAQRVMSLFEEDYSLRPMSTWLPELRHTNKARFDEIVSTIDKLLGKSDFKFTGEQGNDDEYVFDQKGIKIPLPALSDGYRAYLGWIGDLMYHVSTTCPEGKLLVENRGIVMVDEIDLHLHPRWQMRVLPDLAKALPNVQFIATSHSPLIVGSLQWMNILVMNRKKNGASIPQRTEQGVHGLDADQILLTRLFGLSTTRSADRSRKLTELSHKAAAGDEESAKRLLEQMTRGEDVQS